MTPAEAIDLLKVAQHSIDAAIFLLDPADVDKSPKFIEDALICVDHVAKPMASVSSGLAPVHSAAETPPEEMKS